MVVGDLTSAELNLQLKTGYKFYSQFFKIFMLRMNSTHFLTKNLKNHQNFDPTQSLILKWVRPKNVEISVNRFQMKSQKHFWLGRKLGYVGPRIGQVLSELKFKLKEVCCKGRGCSTLVIVPASTAWPWVRIQTGAGHFSFFNPLCNVSQKGAAVYIHQDQTNLVTSYFQQNLSKNQRR